MATPEQLLSIFVDTSWPLASNLLYTIAAGGKSDGDQTQTRKQTKRETHR